MTLETRIRRTIEKVFEDGHFMNDGNIFDGRWGACGLCILGALCMYGSLELSNNQIRALEAGYANWDVPWHELDGEMYSLGRLLRKDYYGGV